MRGRLRSLERKEKGAVVSERQDSQRVLELWREEGTFVSVVPWNSFSCSLGRRRRVQHRQTTASTASATTATAPIMMPALSSRLCEPVPISQGRRVHMHP